MASLLTPAQAERFRPARGYVLLQVLPAESQTTSGLLHLPEAAAEMEMQVQAIRKAKVVKINRGGALPPGCSKWPKGRAPFYDQDSLEIRLERTVFYLGRQSEIDNDYVVVMIGQIVAVETL